MSAPRTYDEARALLGKTEIASVAGGRYKYLHYETGELAWTDEDDAERLAVAARLFATDIVTWYPNGRIVLNTGGWSTPSTFDGMAVALGVPRSMIGTRNHVPHYLDQPFDLVPSGLPGRSHHTLTIHPDKEDKS